jgi:LuxR family maltose regulon positive regulatory protein
VGAGSVDPARGRRGTSLMTGGMLGDPGHGTDPATVSGTVRAGADLVVETKLHAPAVCPEWMERPDLVRDLDESTARLILIAAPAGYGKTILLAQWRHTAARTRPFAGVSLDPGDNDPHRFWWHVASALQRACPGPRSADLFRGLRGQTPDIPGVFIPRLVNELAALATPVVIVLDDYHLITQRSCHQQLESLLLHLPPPTAIALSTRADPPLPLGRLRAAGDLTEIRMQELCFTANEATALIRSVAPVRLCQRDLSGLQRRTGGWPAGVYLAALCLRADRDPTAFARRFATSTRQVADFLIEEFLSHQAPRVEQFLLHTAILDRFTASLCDAVAGTADGQDIIEHLERENLLVVPLDDDREWFGYQPLLAQMLRRRLARAEPDAAAVLRQRASGWHEQHGSAQEAIDHVLAAPNVTRAVDLIAGHWYAIVDAGRAATVAGWLQSLGDDQIAASPLAAHCMAWTAALTGDRETVRRCLPVIDAGAYDGALPDGMRSLQSSAALLVGTFGFTGLAETREAAARAMELESDPAAPWYGLARAAFGTAQYFSGNFPAATRQLEEALVCGLPAAFIHLYALTVMTVIAVQEGRLEQAYEVARAARELATDPALGLQDAPQGALARIAAGTVDAATGRLEEARSEFEHAQLSRRPWPGLSPWADFEIQLRLAPVLLELDDRSSAEALVGQARTLLASFPEGAGAQQDRLARLERRLTGAA